MTNPFAKYFYKPGDTILIKAKAIDSKGPAVFKVEVLHHTLTGYVVKDGDGLRYFVPYRHVIVKD